eukprot:TRINITY_DN29063_c0_g2_i2.p1 TRINITY_DN29063_c0_g2~~TRINITY_DN29063_c0_g2_i2.p1  ORF type:complete len:869 (+),score=186.11 TRINITY_DN29063_c0_g2_i2:83-2689(+)
MVFFRRQRRAARPERAAAASPLVCMPNALPLVSPHARGSGAARPAGPGCGLLGICSPRARRSRRRSPASTRRGLPGRAAVAGALRPTQELLSPLPSPRSVRASSPCGLEAVPSLWSCRAAAASPRVAAGSVPRSPPPVSAGCGRASPSPRPPPREPRDAGVQGAAGSSQGLSSSCSSAAPLTDPVHAEVECRAALLREEECCAALLQCSSAEQRAAVVERQLREAAAECDRLVSVNAELEAAAAAARASASAAARDRDRAAGQLQSAQRELQDSRAEAVRAAESAERRRQEDMARIERLEGRLLRTTDELAQRGAEAERAEREWAGEREMFGAEAQQRGEELTALCDEQRQLSARIRALEAQLSEKDSQLAEVRQEAELAELAQQDYVDELIYMQVDQDLEAERKATELREAVLGVLRRGEALRRTDVPLAVDDSMPASAALIQLERILLELAEQRDAAVRRAHSPAPDAAQCAVLCDSGALGGGAATAGDREMHDDPAPGPPAAHGTAPQCPAAPREAAASTPAPVDVEALSWSTNVLETKLSVTSLGCSLLAHWNVYSETGVDPADAKMFFDSVAKRCNGRNTHSVHRCADSLVSMHVLLRACKEASMPLDPWHALTAFLTASALNLLKPTFRNANRAGPAAWGLVEPLAQLVLAKCKFSENVVKDVRSACFVEDGFDKDFLSSALEWLKAQSPAKNPLVGVNRLTFSIYFPLLLQHLARLVDWSAWAKPKAVHLMWTARFNRPQHHNKLENLQGIAVRGSSGAKFAPRLVDTECEMHAAFLASYVCPLTASLANIVPQVAHIAAAAEALHLDYLSTATLSRHCGDQPLVLQDGLWQVCVAGGAVAGCSPASPWQPGCWYAAGSTG